MPFHKLNGVMNRLFHTGAVTLYGWKLFLVVVNPTVLMATEFSLGTRCCCAVCCSRRVRVMGRLAQGTRHRKSLKWIHISIAWVISYTFLHTKHLVCFTQLCLQLGSYCFLAVNGGGFRCHMMTQCDKSLFSDESSLRGNKHEMPTNCTSAETSVSGINILIFIRATQDCSIKVLSL